MRSDHQRNGDGAVGAATIVTPTQQTPAAPDSKRSVGGTTWRLADLAPHVFLAALLLVQVLWAIPAQLEATHEARRERQARETAARTEQEAAAAHGRLADDARKRETLRLADTIRAQEEAVKIAEENVRLAKELNKQLRREGE